VQAIRGVFASDGDLAGKVIKRSQELSSMWNPRQKMMNEWYKIIRLDNYLEQEDMESSITNQPKNTFRFARHLLVTSAIQDKISRIGASAEQEPGFERLEVAIAHFWKKLEQRAEDMGDQGWLWKLAGLMTSLGWYSVFTDINEKEVTADVWHPYQVFPLWTPGEGLFEVVRTYTVDKKTAIRNIELMGEKIPDFFPAEVTVHNHWIMEGGVALNTLIYNRTVVKGRVGEKSYIPIITGPASGMPDQGVLPSNRDWAGSWGEAVVAHNEGVLENYNKLTSYILQTARDAANPRWVEYVNGGGSILDPEEIFKRGAIFTAETDERVEPLVGPVLPIEASTSLADMRADIGSGSFNDTIMGDVQGPISSVMLSTMVGNTRHLIDAYSKAISRIRRKSATWWWEEMKENKWKPHDISLSFDQVKGHVEWETQISLNIPGDLTNRATQARMLSPEWEMSEQRVTEILFAAEIESIPQELARRNA
ncbi:hypothetical protein LCGC14_2558370, partial [marine sediment metagenome]